MSAKHTLRASSRKGNIPTSQHKLCHPTPSEEAVGALLQLLDPEEAEGAEKRDCGSSWPLKAPNPTLSGCPQGQHNSVEGLCSFCQCNVLLQLLHGCVDQLLPTVKESIVAFFADSGSLRFVAMLIKAITRSTADAAKTEHCAAFRPLCTRACRHRQIQPDLHN